MSKPTVKTLNAKQTRYYNLQAEASEAQRYAEQMERTLERAKKELGLAIKRAERGKELYDEARTAFYGRNK